MSEYPHIGTYTNSLVNQLKMARDALMAQQTAMNTVSHNISNVNTPGYHRQRTVFETRGAKPGLPGQHGSGVNVQAIERSYNTFLTRQERIDAGEVGRWAAQKDMLSRVEEVMNELSDYGIGNALSAFWNSWQDLSNDVDSVSSRIDVVNKAKDLGRAIHDTYTRLDTTRKEVNIGIQTAGDTINEYAKRIADLNEQIYTVVTRQQNPNDLMDQRDQLVKELSSVVNITIQEEENGSVSVYLGNEALVTRNITREVSWISDNDAESGKSSGNLVWADTEEELQINGGDIFGHKQVRDMVSDMMEDLDTFADTIREQVNTLHLTGTGKDGSKGNNFFRPDVSGAQSLIVDQMIVDHPEKIAASTDFATGDSNLAHDIYRLQFEDVFNEGTANYEDFYQGMVVAVGDQLQIAQTKHEAAVATMQQTESWQQIYTGVNLDEEMSEMITVQYAFTAASKLANVLDQMMQQIVNGFI